MKVRVIFLIALCIFASGFMNDAKVFSQPNKSSSFDPPVSFAPPKKTMTCDDIRFMLSRNPAAACSFDSLICAECLGIEGDLAFDTTHLTTDNISDRCLQFFNKVSGCLSGVKDAELEMLNNYLDRNGNSDSSGSGPEVNDAYGLNDLKRLKDLIVYQDIINNYLTSINKYYVYQLKHIKKTKVKSNN